MTTLPTPPQLAPIHVGPVQIDCPVILAPMTGVTDLPFRQLAFRFGAGLVVTEMVASRELVFNAAESWSRLKGAGLTPHMVQLAGREAKWLAEAAVIAMEGIEGVITGRALYEGRLDLAAAIAMAESVR